MFVSHLWTGKCVYFVLTDEHKMGLRVSISSPAQLEAVVSELMKQYRKHHWIEFSCEPWPPNRGKRGPLKKKTAGFWFQDLNTAITRYSSVSAQGTTCGEQLCPVRLKRGRDG